MLKKHKKFGHIVTTFLYRKNSGVQTASNARATSCVCNGTHKTKYKAQTRRSLFPAISFLMLNQIAKNKPKGI